MFETKRLEYTFERRRARQALQGTLEPYGVEDWDFIGKKVARMKLGRGRIAKNRKVVACCDRSIGWIVHDY